MSGCNWGDDKVSLSNASARLLFESRLAPSAIVSSLLLRSPEVPSRCIGGRVDLNFITSQKYRSTVHISIRYLQLIDPELLHTTLM